MSSVHPWGIHTCRPAIRSLRVRVGARSEKSHSLMITLLFIRVVSSLSFQANEAHILAQEVSAHQDRVRLYDRL